MIDVPARLLGWVLFALFLYCGSENAQNLGGACQLHSPQQSDTCDERRGARDDGIAAVRVVREDPLKNKTSGLAGPRAIDQDNACFNHDRPSASSHAE